MASDFLLIVLFLVMAAVLVGMAAAAVRTAYQLSQRRQPDAPQVFYDRSALANFRPGQSGPNTRTQKKERPGELPLPAHTTEEGSCL
jgi:hypothetical protein